MPSNKKFAYAAGDEGDTDSFITSTITSAPKNADQLELQTGQFASSRDGSYYAVDHGGRKEFRNNCARIIVFVFSAILLLVGIGLMVGAGLEKKQGGILPICPNCDKIITALFAIGGIVLAFGLLGFFAASSRSTFVSCIFIFVLVILTLLFLGTGIGFIVIQGGTHLEDMWTGAVAHDGDAVCNVQKNLKCSGFNFCCYTGNETNTTTATTTTTTTPVTTSTAAAPILYDDEDLGNATTGTTTTTTTAAPVSAQCSVITDPAQAAKYCVSSCYSSAPPCAPILKDDLKKLTAPVAGVAFPLGVFCALVAWASKRMLTKEE